MSVTVRFERNCVGDFGARSSDEIAMIRTYIDAIIDLFGQHGGHLPGARKVRGVPAWVWEDANWKIGYHIADRLFGRTVTIHSIRLKWRHG